MTLLLLPAALLAAPLAPTPAEVLIEALEGVPECLVEGRSERLEARIRYVQDAWASRRDTLAKRIPPLAFARLDRCFLHMVGAGRTAALSALEAQAVLAELLPQGRTCWLRDAHHACLQAWCAVDAARWAELPDLEATLAPLLGPGCPGSVEMRARAALGQHRQALATRNAPRCKGALRTLQGLLREMDDEGWSQGGAKPDTGRRA